jgi:hypothetical protein
MARAQLLPRPLAPNSESLRPRHSPPRVPPLLRHPPPRRRHQRRRPSRDRRPPRRDYAGALYPLGGEELRLDSCGNRHGQAGLAENPAFNSPFSVRLHVHSLTRRRAHLSASVMQEPRRRKTKAFFDRGSLKPRSVCPAVPGADPGTAGAELCRQYLDLRWHNLNEPQRRGHIRFLSVRWQRLARFTPDGEPSRFTKMSDERIPCVTRRSSAPFIADNGHHCPFV